MTIEADEFRDVIKHLNTTAKDLHASSRDLQTLIETHLESIPLPVLEAWMTHLRKDTDNIQALNAFLAWSLAYFTEHPL